jgi:RNA polymerase sigma-70 factor (ECF subfamily)
MGEITQLLQQWRAGDREAEGELFARVGPDLRRMAQALMRRERPGHTMQATELVNEIYFRMVAAKDRDWRSRAHFFAIAGRAMRRYLIDHARGRAHANVIAFDEMEQILPAESIKLELVIAVDRLLDQLEKLRPEWCQVVEVKYFLGLTDDEAAAALGLKLRSLQRIWSDARLWLFEHMEPVA